MRIEVRSPYDGASVGAVEATDAAGRGARARNRARGSSATAGAGCPRPARIEILSGAARRMQAEAEQLARRGGQGRRQAAGGFAGRGRPRHRRRAQLLRAPARRGRAGGAHGRQRRLGGPGGLHPARADRPGGGGQRLQPPGQPDRAPGGAGDRGRLPGHRQAGRRDPALVPAAGRHPARGGPAGGLVPAALDARATRSPGGSSPTPGWASSASSAAPGSAGCCARAWRRAPAARWSTAARRR